MKKNFLLLIAIPAALCAQTTINGSRIIKGSLDASGSTRSLPNRTGTGSPAGRDNCLTPGETYFQSDATPGQNLWVCTVAGTPGTWNQISGSAGSSGNSVVTGTTSPSGSCSAGSFYLRTDIQELYVCSGTNFWELASYASGNTANRPIGCVSGQLYVATDTGELWYCAVTGSLGNWQAVTPLTNVSWNGMPQGAFSTLNLANAPGANWTVTPNGQALSISSTPDTTYLLSQTAAQNGAPFLCTPNSNDSSAYSCSITPAPAALSNGMLVEFRPDVSCAGGPTTLNLNGLGAKPIYSLDGSSNPAANDCRANRPTWLAYSAALNSGAGAFVLQSAANLPAVPNTPPSGGQIPVGNSAGTAYAPQSVSGDATLSSTGALTFATVNSSPGTCGSGTAICQITTNAKGLVTGQTAVPISAGNAGVTQTTVPYSSSVTFTRFTNIQEFILTLSGNVTSSSTSGFTAGDIYYFEICQNSTGGYTLAWPSSGFAQAPTVDPTPNVCTKFHGTWDTSGTLQVSGVPTTSENPFLISQAHERAAPSTPAAGFEALWPDQTRNTWTGINNAGNLHILPRVKTTNTTDQLNSSDLGDYTSIARMSGTYTQGDCANIQSFTGGNLTVGDAGAPCGTSSGGSVTSVFGQTGVVPNLSGDVTTSGSSVTTLATINTSPGSCGDATHVCQVTTNGKGLVTGQAAIAITAGGTNYQTVDANGAAIMQRPTLNLISGTNTTVNCVDNSGQTRTDCTISASAGAGGYSIIESNATPLTQRSTLNFSSEFTAVDNSGAGRTDVSVNSIAAGKVSGLQVSALSDAANVNTLNGTQTITGNKTFTGTVTASASPHTLPVQVASSAPPTCTVGEMYFNSSAAAGQNLYFCTSTNTWTQMTGGGSSTATETLYIPAASGGTSGTSAVFGPGLDAVSTGTTIPVPTKLTPTGTTQYLAALSFPNNASTATSVYATWQLPQNWSSSGAVNVVLSILKGSTTGTAEFNVATQCSSPGSTVIGSGTWSGATLGNSGNDQPVTVVSTSQAYELVNLTFNSLSMTGCSAGNTIQFRIYRDQTNSSDTMAGSIYLLGLQIQWQHN
jgi:hypothetical protein